MKVFHTDISIRGCEFFSNGVTNFHRKTGSICMHYTEPMNAIIISFIGIIQCRYIYIWYTYMWYVHTTIVICNLSKLAKIYASVCGYFVCYWLREMCAFTGNAVPVDERVSGLLWRESRSVGEEEQYCGLPEEQEVTRRLFWQKSLSEKTNLTVNAGRS